MILKGVEALILSVGPKGIPSSFYVIEKSIDGQKARVPIYYSQPTEERLFRFSLSFMRTFRALVREDDVVIIHGLWQFPCLFAAYECRKQKIPYLIFTHAMLSRYSFGKKNLRKTAYFNLFERANLNAAQAVAYMDEEEKNFAYSLGVRSNPFYFYSGLNAEDIVTSDPDYGSSKILFLSRIHPKKNLDKVAEAFLKIAPRYPYTELLIAGPIEDKKHFITIQEMISRSAVASRVKWVGPLEGNDKRAFLSSGSIFVHPSKDDSRPLAILEAMAAGLPIITTPGCKMPQIQNEMGYVVAESANLLAGAMEKLLQDPSLRQKMGRSSRRYVLENCMWSQKIDDLMSRISMSVSK
jgi:glycosyltransferase involved in cell wall biosynthesis